MKETRFFYVPDVAKTNELPCDEAVHAVRVLRMKQGDQMILMDGVGTFFLAEVTMAVPHHCGFRVLETMPQQPQWKGKLHIAIAPTKMIDRMEWLLEKMTEVGIDEVSFLDSANSERRVVKTERLDKIVVSAMKQSRKAWKPIINGIQSFPDFLSHNTNGKRYIAHCYSEIPRTYLFDELKASCSVEAATVLIGPEGDFTVDEVNKAMAEGYVSVHLGDSRLRTETAALVATMMIHLSNS